MDLWGLKGKIRCFPSLPYLPRLGYLHTHAKINILIYPFIFFCSELIRPCSRRPYRPQVPHGNIAKVATRVTTEGDRDFLRSKCITNGMWESTCFGCYGQGWNWGLWYQEDASLSS
jgi:hypothetical protein